MTFEATTSANDEQALTQAFQSGNRAHCISLLGQCARTWLKAGEVDSVVRWTDQLSQAEILGNEVVATSYIASMIFRRRFIEAATCLQEVAGSQSNRSAVTQARLRTLRLMLDALSDNANDDALLAEVGEGPCDDYLTGALVALQAYALMRKSRFDAAKRRALRARDLMAEHGDAYGASYAAVLVSLAQRASGDLLGSAQTCERLFASLEHGARNPAWVNAASALSHLRYEQNRLAEARSLCHELLPLLPSASTPENFASVYITLARSDVAAGNMHEAAHLLEYLHSAMEDGRHARLVALVVYERVRVALICGEAELARRIADEASISELAENKWWSLPNRYEPRWDRLGQTHALLLLHEHKTDACRAVLHTLIRCATHAGCISRVIGLEALLASCEWLAGDRARAFAATDRALSRTRSVGFSRSVFDESPEFVTVLCAGIKERKLLHSVPAGYLKRWSALLGAGDVNALGDEGPVEPLTGRERSVLTLLCAGLRNEDISERLCIALSTTKWHIKNIFAKLGVACRTEAVVRARQLRLIS